jgi:hypothetical protein
MHQVLRRSNGERALCGPAMHLPVTFAFSLATTLLMSCSQKQWVDVRPSTGEFVVSMPAQPTLEKQSKDFAFGKLTWVNYNVNQGETSFMVSFVDYPDAIMTNLTSDRILASGLDQIMRTNPSRRPLKDSTGLFQGFPSKDSVVDDAPLAFTTIARQVLVGNRMYLIQVNTPTKQSESRDIQRFMDSLKLATSHP